MFENAISLTRQGDIGEARAIYEYTRLGFVVSRTLFDSARYDLIVDAGAELKRVQVKTSRQVSKFGGYVVQLQTTGGNRKINTIRTREDSDYDELFILTADNRCWSIPVKAIVQGKHSITVGNQRYSEYQLTGP